MESPTQVLMKQDSKYCLDNLNQVWKNRFEYYASIFYIYFQISWDDIFKMTEEIFLKNIRSWRETYLEDSLIKDSLTKV